MSALDPSLLPPGTLIGGDVVEAVLGSGGFGTVYQVRDSEGDRSALKMVPLEKGEDRAWREALMGSRLYLQHPNLARPRHAGGTFTLTLWSQEGSVRGELLDGVTFP